KTKRIVALALAGALALGAVATPVLADAPKALDLSAKKTTEAYAKIVKAQKEVVSDAQKKYDDAVASEAKKKAELE
ncbi:hypothetical protein NL500_31395, partial [Klebsiella pneumoniae]|nr:hypothetical protein [Klebsiella pneumoniae]